MTALTAVKYRLPPGPQKWYVPITLPGFQWVNYLEGGEVGGGEQM